MPKVSKRQSSRKSTTTKSKAKPVSTEEYSLPTAPSEPSNKMEDYTHLIYGAKKIGKTSMMQYFNNPMYFMFEPGGRALRIYQELMQHNWLKFTKLVPQFLKSKKFNVGIIDTADMCYKACFDFTCKRLVIDHPTDEDYGKGWEAVKDEFIKWVMLRLMSSDKGIVFLSHEHVYEVKSRGGSSSSRIEPSMAKQPREMIDAAVDIWGYYTYDGTQRVLQIEGDEIISAGNRLVDHFLYPDGEPIKYIPMGNNAEQAFRNYERAFHNDLPRESGTKTKKPVSRKKLRVKR